LYLNALHNPFVYDDYHTVVENRSIARVTDLRAIVVHDVTRPIVNLSYAIDRRVWGSRPFGFHASSVLLHMLNVFLLAELVRRLSGNRVASFVSAVLFAVHPMMTEAVGYISGRSELLCATFFLPALACGRRWLVDGGRASRTGTIALWTASLAAKETAAMFPFLLAVLDWLAGTGTADDRRRRILHIHLPLVAAAAIAGVIRLIVLTRIEYPEQVGVHWHYLLLDFDVVSRYLRLMISPNGQAIFHEVADITGLFDHRALIALAAVTAAIGVAAWLRHRAWLVSLGIVWFLLLLVPSSVLILFDQGEPMTEHRVYLASCGLFLGGGVAIAGIAERARAFGARGWVSAGSAFAAVLLSFALETVVRNAVWHDPVALWRESADLAPTHYRPRLLLGEALEDAGRRREALDQFEAAIRLRPAEPTGYVKAGRCLAEDGRLAEARPYFVKALEVDPRNQLARQSLALLDTLGPALGHDGRRR
jgi:hypothetical protein